MSMQPPKTRRRPHEHAVAERRRGERRVASLHVKVDMRRGKDRRKGHRWTTGRAERARYVLPETGGLPASRMAADLVGEAFERMAASWRHDVGDGISVEEACGLREALVTAIGRHDRGEAPDAQLQSVAGRRLLELVRREIIREWCNCAVRPLARDMLDALDAIESVAAAIEPDRAQEFANQLSGPDGMELVVEVAHDLRSPLTSILFLAETLQRQTSGDLNELQHRQLGLIYSAALGLSEIASNVVEIARGGSQLAEDEPTPFSVTEILESVLDIVRPMAEEKKLAIRLNPPATDHRLGHPVALSRVLLNLTTNALKFTEEGFVEIVARENGPTLIEFSVRDSGPGISSDAHHTLYSPFRLTKQGDHKAFSSTGLGLALCRRLVQAMGSELQYESKRGWGTRFHFELTLEPLDTPQVG